MKRLRIFQITCVILWIVCCIALYIGIYVHDIESMTAVYVWAGLALAALWGNAAAALLRLGKRR